MAKGKVFGWSKVRLTCGNTVLNISFVACFIVISCVFHAWYNLFLGQFDGRTPDPQHGSFLGQIIYLRRFSSERLFLMRSISTADTSC